MVVQLSDSDDVLNSFRNLGLSINQRKQVIEKIEQSFSDLDTTINFKVNSHLKDEFDRICKSNHSTISRELKLFMLRSIKSNRIL